MSELPDPRADRSRLTAFLDWLFDGALLGPLRTGLGAVVITAGPWLVFVVGLAIISLSMQPVLGRGGIEDLRLSVVYAFLVAPLVAGPIGGVAAGLIRQQIEGDGPRMVFETFAVAAVVSGLLSQGLAVLVCLGLGINPYGIAIAFVFLSGAGALLWVSFAVLGALRSSAFLIIAFSAGMAISIAAIMLVATATAPTVEAMIWCFTAGIAACIALALAYVRGLAGYDPRRLGAAARAILAEARAEWQLALGVFLALTGIWMDKWVLWVGPEGAKTAAGFLHFSSYDSVMFLAHLSIIPAFAAMQIFHETTLTRAIGAFRRTLTEGASYARVREAVQTLGNVVWTDLFRIVFIQLTITTALVLTAPLLARMLDLRFAQFLVLRVGLIAVFLHSIIYLSCAILLLCGRKHMFLLVQLSFLVVNLAASIVLYAAFGVTAYPIFLSSLVVGMLAFWLALRSLARYDYLVLVGENDSLYKG